MKQKTTSKPEATDRTDWDRVDAMDDKDIDVAEHPEWTDKDFAVAKRQGPQKAPKKEPVSIRLSPEVVAYFKSTGKGWQTRLDDVLREYVASR